MICRWAYKGYAFEFDAVSKADEMRKLREFIKKYGYKFNQMVKEE